MQLDLVGYAAAAATKGNDTLLNLFWFAELKLQHCEHGGGVRHMLPLKACHC
jgi:hypothetical protein